MNFVQPGLYGVIGNPVGHSLSPVMHNAAFQKAGVAAFFGAFAVAEDQLAAALAGMRALGIKGFSVTIPHKVAVIEQLDEVDEEARRIGAVNTVINRGGRLCGSNTDAPGALRALREKIDPAGRRVLVLGAGGAARALVYGLTRAGAEVFIANRSPEKGRRLAAEFAAAAIAISELKDFSCEILVNTTPVGMFPAVDRMPVPESLLKPGMVVMDIVYNPLRTRLLAAAAARGAAIVDGLGMFVGQGALQFELWTGRPAPLEIMRRAVLEVLQKKEDRHA
jgi:shikimate dehydrogenase